MYAIFVNNTDVTDKVERRSLQIKEALNNRRNTATFSLIDDSFVEEHQVVEIFKYSPIVTASGTSITIDPDERFEYEKRFFSGQKIIVGIKDQNEAAEVQDVNYTTGVITLTASLSGTFSAGDKVGVKIFGGIISQIPDDDIGKSDILLKKVTCLDFSYLLSKKNVVDTYIDMYAREIISRFIYKFTARNTTQVITDFENVESFTNYGVATAPAFSTENITGNYTLKVGASGAGVGGYSLNVSSLNLSSFENLRLWIKTPENIADVLNSFTLKIGTDSSNFFSYSISREKGGLWAWEDFDLVNPTGKTGTPSLANITWFSFEFSAITSFASGQILLDEASATSGGFTLGNVERGNIKYEDVRSQYKNPDDLLEQFSKLERFFWYVDYNRDIHFFSSTSRENLKFEISPTSNNYNDLKRKVDVSQLKNRQTIRGGSAPGEASYTQERETDGLQKSWTLDYPPKNMEVFVDTGSGYVPQSVGVENLTDETTVDYVFNFSEKTIRAASAAVLAKGSKIKFTYIPYKDIRVRYQDNESIKRVKALLGGDGVFDGAVINDESIRSFSEARARAKAEIEAYKNPVVTITFETEIENLEPGQLIQITDPAREIDDKFLIQSVSTRSKDLDTFVYSVTAASTMFGYIEFFQLLFKRTEKGLVDVNEIVDIIQNMDEEIDFVENYVLTQKSNIFYAMGETPGQTPNDAYASFSEAS